MDSLSEADQDGQNMENTGRSYEHNDSRPPNLSRVDIIIIMALNNETWASGILSMLICNRVRLLSYDKS